jgi:hypothetical protein
VPKQMRPCSKQMSRRQRSCSSGSGLGCKAQRPVLRLESRATARRTGSSGRGRRGLMRLGRGIVECRQSASRLSSIFLSDNKVCRPGCLYPHDGPCQCLGAGHGGRLTNDSERLFLAWLLHHCSTVPIIITSQHACADKRAGSALGLSIIFKSIFQ